MQGRFHEIKLQTYVLWISLLLADILINFQLIKEELVAVGFLTAAPLAIILAGMFTTKNSIFYAARDGNIDRVRKYLERGGDVNAKNNNDYSTVYYAAQDGHQEIVALLIANSADVNAKRDDGATPLHWAVGNGHSEVVNLLIQQGADVNEKDKNGCISLHLVPVKGIRDMALLLIENGAEVNAKTNPKYTPLHLSVSCNADRIAALLIDNGAEVDAQPTQTQNNVRNYQSSATQRGTASASSACSCPEGRGMLQTPPLHPVSLSESEHVCLEVRFRVPPVEPETRQQIQTLLEKAAQQVKIRKPTGKVDPAVEAERHQLAEELGKIPGKPLSEIAIEQRGPW
ncbi:MAG: ankyrin repeat domain-containing protein [Hormoscilla sp. GM7CHS1pb]|nr:ankyrin repeat domain-containing protein [Hormoscilla sp. GM7CHS1pb]